MRVDFTKAAHQAMGRDEKSIFITGDLGYNALEQIASEFPKRFLNAGVAEQNMIGVAAGMALTGMRPWVYSIAPFTTFRCLEQIRNDVCLHRLPVRIVGNGGGYTYGIMGSTHHALEDIAVLKALPNLKLYFPGTNDQVAAAVEQISRLEGPSYLRLAISGFASTATPLSENGQTLTRHYAKGSSVTVIGVGHAVQIALTALQKNDLASHDVDVFGICRYPFDLDTDKTLLDSIRKTGRVLVIEEHYQPGSIAESLALELPRTQAFVAMTARYAPEQSYGSSQYHLKQSGLTPEALIEAVKRLKKG